MSAKDHQGWKEKGTVCYCFSVTKKVINVERGTAKKSPD